MSRWSRQRPLTPRFRRARLKPGHKYRVRWELPYIYDKHVAEAYADPRDWVPAYDRIGNPNAPQKQRYPFRYRHEAIGICDSTTEIGAYFKGVDDGPDFWIGLEHITQIKELDVERKPRKQSRETKGLRRR